MKVTSSIDLLYIQNTDAALHCIYYSVVQLF
jgi:hypothetical protein